MSELSEAIRRIRVSLGTQAEVAKRLGVKRNTVSQYETGDAAPSFPVLMRLHSLAADGPDRAAVYQYLESTMERFDDVGVLEDLLAGNMIVMTTPPTDNPHNLADLERFALIVGSIRNGGPKLDRSVIDILDTWRLCGDDPEMVNIFRKIAKFLNLQMTIMAKSGSLTPSTGPQLKRKRQARMKKGNR